jgi:hypothetical protein
MLLIVVPAAASLLAVFAGRTVAHRADPGLRRIVWGAIAGCSVLFAMVAYSWRAHGVSVGQALGGAALALVLGAALPLSAFYALGRVVRNAFAVAACWLASLVPLGYYGFVVMLLIAKQTSCPPGAYECPV